MKTKQIITLSAAFILLFAGACTKDNSETKQETDSSIDTLVVPHQTKGYELYSWPEGNEWFFSVMVGTNSIKSYAEVISINPSAVHLITVTGFDKLKAVLARFPENEYITWIGKKWLQSAWVDSYGNLQLPPQNNIDDITNFCTQRKLNLQVTD